MCLSIRGKRYKKISRKKTKKTETEEENKLAGYLGKEKMELKSVVNLLRDNVARVEWDTGFGKGESLKGGYPFTPSVNDIILSPSLVPTLKPICPKKYTKKEMLKCIQKINLSRDKSLWVSSRTSVSTDTSTDTLRCPIRKKPRLGPGTNLFTDNF